MYHPVHALTKEVQHRNPEKFGPGKCFCLMGVLYIEICILVIHGEFINGRGLYKILSKSNMSTTGIQHLFTGSDVKTTRYCISNLFEMDSDSSKVVIRFGIYQRAGTSA